MKSRISLLSSFVVILAAPNEPFAQVNEPTREQMEASQTDGYGVRRGKRKADEEWLEPQRLREEFGRRTSGGASTPASSNAGTRPESGGTSSAPSQGTVTGSGTSTTTAAGRGRGIVTGSDGPGPSNHPGRGHGHGARGVVTGAGAAHSGGPGSGKGVVNAAGAAPAAAGSPARPAGAGIVTAGGAVVAPSIAGAPAPGAGIVSGAGGPPGHANNQGHGRSGRR